MRRCGHADGYARTLVMGEWPSLDVFPPTERAATGKKLRQLTVRLPQASARPATRETKRIASPPTRG